MRSSYPDKLLFEHSLCPLQDVQFLENTEVITEVTDEEDYEYIQIYLNRNR